MKHLSQLSGIQLLALVVTQPQKQAAVDKVLDERAKGKVVFKKAA